jgi:hypothetical protein
MMIDEIEKMQFKDQTFLLNLMDRGIIKTPQNSAMLSHNYYIICLLCNIASMSKRDETENIRHKFILKFNTVNCRQIKSVCFLITLLSILSISPLLFEKTFAQAADKNKTINIHYTRTWVLVTPDGGVTTLNATSQTISGTPQQLLDNLKTLSNKEYAYERSLGISNVTFTYENQSTKVFSIDEVTPQMHFDFLKPAIKPGASWCWTYSGEISNHARSCVIK